MGHVFDLGTVAGVAAVAYRLAKSSPTRWIASELTGAREIVIAWRRLRRTLRSTGSCK
jgi:hypothetical protein